MPWPPSKSKSVMTPLMSMMLMREDVQLSASICGQHRSTYLYSSAMCGSEYRCTVPLSRPTSSILSEAQMHVMGSCRIAGRQWWGANGSAAAGKRGAL